MEPPMRPSSNAPSVVRSPIGTRMRGTAVDRVAWRSTPRYLGISTRTSWPSVSRTVGSAPATSARPPVFANGSTSDEIRRTRRGCVTWASGEYTGLIIPSPPMLSNLFEDRHGDGSDVGADPLQVGQHVEVDVGRLERIRAPGAQADQVGFAQLALALADERPAIEHLLGEPAIVRGERRDRALEVLGDEPVELQQLGPALVRELSPVIELLAGQLDQVLVDDVADVLEVADQRDQRDLLAGEVGRHRLPVEPRQEELDL